VEVDVVLGVGGGGLALGGGLSRRAARSAGARGTDSARRVERGVSSPGFLSVSLLVGWLGSLLLIIVVVIVVTSLFEEDGRGERS
jgi:hypothetical protein